MASGIEAAEKVIKVLKQHKNGIPRSRLVKEAGITSDTLVILFNSRLKYGPIGYDDEIFDMIYWCGL